MGITEEQLESLAKVMLPTGHARFSRNRGGVKPRLVDGIELVNGRKGWAISLFRNVNNEYNDVEIAIAVARIVDDGGQAGSVLKWLESVRTQFQHGEHKPHHSIYKGNVFRIGLKLAEAQTFLGLVMAEVLKAPSKAPWDTTGHAAVVAAAVEPTAQVSVPPNPSDDRAKAIARMARMALHARDQSGLERTTITKNKEIRFASVSELQAHIDALWKSDHCTLSGLKLDLTGVDPDLAPSLDRIDSNKHYESGNLQVVAWFINRWKNEDVEGNFVRLLKLVRAHPAQVPGHGQATPSDPR